MKSACSTSSVAERVNRISTAPSTSARVTTGSARLRTAAAGSSQPSVGNPPAGSTPHSTANRVMSISPTQKLGTAMPSWLSVDRASPSARRCRAAEMIPSGSATATARTVAPATSGAVTVSFSPSCADTDTPFTAEAPKSPVRTPPTQLAYWVISGRSTPSWWRILATCSGEAVVPAITSATSPGSSRSSRKTSRLAATSDRASRTRRRSRITAMGPSFALPTSSVPRPSEP